MRLAHFLRNVARALFVKSDLLFYALSRLFQSI
jgi:hypothetical protein